MGYRPWWVERFSFMIRTLANPRVASVQSGQTEQNLHQRPLGHQGSTERHPAKSFVRKRNLELEPAATLYLLRHDMTLGTKSPLILSSALKLLTVYWRNLLSGAKYSGEPGAFRKHPISILSSFQLFLENLTLW